MKLVKNHIMVTSVTATLLLLFCATAFFPKTSEAKTTSWTDTFNQTFYYAWTNGGDSQSDIHNWSEGLKNPNVRITYAATIENCETGANIPDGSTIPVGSNIRLVPKEFEDTDIYWFGTGFSYDSPYGHWVDDAGKPSDQLCHDQDFVENVDYPWGHEQLGVYVPLNVDPPVVTIDVSGSSAGLNELGNGCYEVTSAGEIKTNFNFADTYGKFYYRFKDYNENKLWEYDDVRGGNCIGNDFPMTLSWGKTEFIMDVEERDIDFTLTAVPVAVNHPPNPPVISGTTNPTEDEVETYTFTATDPDNDNIRYHVDWNMDDVVDEIVPAGDVFIPSGTPDETDHSWGGVSTYTFQAKTQDEPGLFSDWTVYTVDVTQANRPPNPPVITGATQFTPGEVETYTFTATDPDNDNIRYHIDWDMDGTVDDIRPADDTFIPSGTADNADQTWGPGNSYTFQAKTQDEPGLFSEWAFYTVVIADANHPPNPPVIAGNQNPTENQTETYTFTATDPDNDGVQYHIDWNMDGTVDAIRPADASFIPSGTTDDADRTWGSVGEYTFQAFTKDDHGLTSDWSTYTVVVDDGGGGGGGGLTITSCSASPNPVTVGQTAVWSAVVSGGDQPYSYRWLDAFGNELGTGDTLSKAYTSIGTVGVTLEVTDNSGATVTKDCDVLAVDDGGNGGGNNNGGGGNGPGIVVSDPIVYPNEPVTVSWYPDGNSCTLSSNLAASANGATDQDGSEEVDITSLTTFYLYCDNGGTYSATVQVIPDLQET